MVLKIIIFYFDFTNQLKEFKKLFMDTKYYVINLDRSKERLQDISLQFSKQSLKLERVVAVDGQVLELNDTADDNEFRKEMGRSIQPGEVGCFLSHRRALEAFILSNAEFAVILEDDAVLEDGFAEHINALSSFLLNNSHLGTCAINLGPSDYKYSTLLTKIGKTELLRAHRFPMRTTGILWTRQGAVDILNDNGKVKYPYDNYLRMKLTRGHFGLSICPPLISSSDVTSVIDTGNNSTGRSHQNRSRFYFLIKQKRILRDKIIAIFSIIKWKFQRLNIE